MKLVKLFLFVLAVIVLGACTSAPVQNDGDHNYRSFTHFDIDDGYYDIIGVVQGLPVMNEFTGVEQMPYRFLGNDDQNMSPVHTMRVLLTNDAKSNQGDIAAEVGSIVGMKVYGSTLNAIIIGDEVKMVCRLQAEAIGAIAPQEVFNPKLAVVWEFENCRPAEPTVSRNPSGR